MTGRAVIPAFVAVSALCAAVAVFQDESPAVAGRSLRVPPLPPPPAWHAPGIDAFPQIIARPVFSPSRRLPAKDDPEVKPVAKAPDGRLVGIVFSEGTKVALIEDPSAKTVMRLQEGQTFGGWKVAAIGADRVILSRQELQHALDLLKPGEGGGAPKGVGRRSSR